MATGNIYIVTAPSGAGKTTLVANLLKADPQVQLSVSYTTRAPREGEVEGRHYHFVSRDSFLEMANNGEFLESAEVYGNFYGTSQRWISEQLRAGRDILLEIDWQGAQQVRRIFPDAIGIFILPPSLETLRERLIGRGKDSAEVIQRRLDHAREDIQHVDEFDYIIVNNDLTEATQDLVALVRGRRLRIETQMKRHAELVSALKHG
ncbi:MAG TPA: guanylate kinase [Candidatus Kapabacteria bacterium]|nr:guanylate kinase [Candidatus Kapabacteria bacterium]